LQGDKLKAMLGAGPYFKAGNFSAFVVINHIQLPQFAAA
jgi:hypothetical protein